MTNIVQYNILTAKMQIRSTQAYTGFKTRLVSNIIP